MTFIPGTDGNNSGLFIPSRRALAGREGRNNGEIVSPARLPMADRRERDDVMSSLLLALDESDEADDDNGSGVDGDPDEINE